LGSELIFLTGSPTWLRAFSGGMIDFCSRLFEEEGLFDRLVPDLVLHGLYVVWQMNL
jgi:hypothetical protein